MWPFHHDFSWGWGWMFFGGLMMLLFWGGLLVAAFFIIRAAIGSGRQHGAPGEQLSASGSKTSLDILKERYAQGEIDKAEYEQIREDLRE